MHGPDAEVGKCLHPEFKSCHSVHIEVVIFHDRREEVSHNTSLTGVPVKVGQNLKNHSIFCTQEKKKKKSVNII